jgi:hypothetical protein
MNSENYNFWQPPLYYILGGFTARLFSATIDSLSFSQALRVVSLLFTTVGLIALYAELRKWKVNWLAAAAGSLLALTFTQILSAATRATTDSIAILAAVLSLTLVRRVLYDKNLSLLFPILATFLITSTKVLHALPLLAAALLIFLESFSGRLSSQRLRGFLISTSIPFVAAFVHIGWSTFQESRVPADWVNPVIGVNTTSFVGLPIREWLGTAFTGANVATQMWVPESYNEWFISFWQSISGPICIMLVLGAWLIFDRNDPYRSAAWITLIVALVWPSAVQLQAYLSFEMYFPQPSVRYGMTILGLVGGLSAMIAHRKRLTHLLIGLAVGGYLCSLLAVLGVFKAV